MKLDIKEKEKKKRKKIKLGEGRGWKILEFVLEVFTFIIDIFDVFDS